jgi:hypothetical protein
MEMKSPKKFVVLHNWTQVNGQAERDERYNFEKYFSPRYADCQSLILPIDVDDKTNGASLRVLVTAVRTTDQVERIVKRKDKTLTDIPKKVEVMSDHTEQFLATSREEAPSYLICGIKRFTLNAYGSKVKRVQPIIPSKTIELQIKDSSETVTYERVAMTVHKGVGLNNGHYVSFLTHRKEGCETIWKYDDLDNAASKCTHEGAMLQEAANGCSIVYYRKKIEEQLPPKEQTTDHALGT